MNKRQKKKRRSAFQNKLNKRYAKLIRKLLVDKTSKVCQFGNTILCDGQAIWYSTPLPGFSPSETCATKKE